MNGHVASPRGRSSRGSAANALRFHNPALADPVGGKGHIDREWGRAAITSPYEWLFTHDLLSAGI